MPEKLGICVATEAHLHHVIGLSKAAKGSGRSVEVFFTEHAENQPS